MALPEDELKKKKNSFGDAAAVASDPSASLVQQARPGQNSPTNTWPGNQPSTNIYGVKQASPAPNPVATDPQATADRAAVGGLWEGVKGFNAKAGAAIADVASLPVRGAVGAYDTAVVRPMRAAGINAAYLSPAVTPAGANPESMTPFYDRLRAGESAASPAPLSAAAAQKNPAAPGLAIDPNGQYAGPLMGYQPTRDSQPGAAEASPLSKSNITRVDNSYSAAGPVTGDVTINGQPPRNGGAISEQNEGAASGLARQQLGQSLARLGTAPQAVGFQPQQFQQSQWASDLARKNAETQASSIHAPTAALGRANVAMLQGERAGALSADAAAQRTAMQESGALARSGNQEQGANFRAGLAAQGTQAANTLRRDEFNREGVAVGFKNDAMLQLQKAQQAVMNAKPEDRPAALATLLALQGKTENAKDNVITLGGGQEWDAAAGMMRNVPQRAIDLRTGREIGGSPAGQNPQLPPGMKRQIGTANGRPVYEDANGKTVVAKG